MMNISEFGDVYTVPLLDGQAMAAWLGMELLVATVLDAELTRMVELEDIELNGWLETLVVVRGLLEVDGKVGTFEPDVTVLIGEKGVVLLEAERKLLETEGELLEAEGKLLEADGELLEAEDELLEAGDEPLEADGEPLVENIMTGLPDDNVIDDAAATVEVILLLLVGDAPLLELRRPDDVVAVFPEVLIIFDVDVGASEKLGMFEEHIPNADWQPSPQWSGE
jgi:hypothetical protein